MASSSNTFMWDWNFQLLAITVFHLQNRPSKLCLEIFCGLNRSPVTRRTSEPLPVHLAMVRLTSCSAGLHASSSVLPPRTLLTSTIRKWSAKRLRISLGRTGRLR